MSGLKRWLILAAALVGMAVTASLGVWQWGRAQERLGLQAAIEERGNQLEVDVAELLGAKDPATLQHRQVVLRGQWVPERTVFLDNRQMRGRPGFYVVTPLKLEGRGESVLVQRGWAPRNFNQRDALPPVETPPGAVDVRGRLAPPPAKLYAFDGKEEGAIRQNLDLAAFRAESGLNLLPLSVQQVGAASEGLLREWPQAASGADKNYGYAAQWWAMSALILILYVWFQLVVPYRKAQRA